MSTWFDYQNQAWVVDGFYRRCAHRICAIVKDDDLPRPTTKNPICYGTEHEGEKPSEEVDARYNPARNQPRVDAFGRDWTDSRSLDDCHSDADPGL